LKYMVEIEWSDGVDSGTPEYVDDIEGVAALLLMEKHNADVPIPDYEGSIHMTVIRITAEEGG
jgi:hypothetical protein